MEVMKIPRGQKGVVCGRHQNGWIVRVLGLCGIHIQEKTQIVGNSGKIGLCIACEDK